MSSSASTASNRPRSNRQTVARVAPAPRIKGAGAAAKLTKTSKKAAAVKAPFALYRSPSEPSIQGGLDTVAHWLKKSKRICVLTGAGISVSCGIPDFRSSNGLYSTLNYQEFGLSCPEELFDYEFFQHSPSAFYQFAAKHGLFWMKQQKEGSNDSKERCVSSGNIMPSDSHKFLRRLEESKRLLRVYTQNMDGLEEKAGVSTKKVVYAHGSLQWSTCLRCKQKVATESILSKDVLAGSVAYCQRVKISNARISSKVSLSREKSLPISLTDSSRSLSSSSEVPPQSPRKSNRKRPLCVLSDEREESTSSFSSNDSYSNQSLCGGVMKPGITFFGQPLNDDVGRCLEQDQDKVDAVIVMGTSLSVAPISKVVAYFPSNIPRILINRTIVEPSRHATNEDDDQDFREGYGFDAYLLGDCDIITRLLTKLVFGDESSYHRKKSNNDDSGILLSSLMHSDDNTFARPDEWTSVRVPWDRVLLFPGAQPPRPALSHSSNGAVPKDGIEGGTILEVAHCDQCHQQIPIGNKIQKCAQCFDYDLCEDCFPTTSKTHFNGEHTFRVE